MRKISLNLIPGDGIGLEVMHECLGILRAVEDLHGGISFACQELDWSCGHYLRHGSMMPKDGLTILSQCDAILLGAVGFPGVPDHVSLQGLLLPIRQGFDQYINMRPIRLLPGLDSPLKISSPEDIDFVVIRENSEGEYCGAGALLNEGTEEETAVQEGRFTLKGVTRVIRYAFEFACAHSRRSLISATKSNALNYSMVFWDRIFAEVRAGYPQIESRSMHIDALAGLMIMKPKTFDVIVASNLFGDILTDLGSAMLGSIGISPSANINPEKRFPSMFEPIHGSAPDIAGRGIANPVGMIWSMVLMLEHLDLGGMAAVLMGALEKVLAARVVRTPDMGGQSTTGEVVEEVCRHIVQG
ncbi:MAG TPA: tartrate dehydrogenase [Deltaproteobacteria bacterium]|nr:tartrate dehydrogenase [Deltaproteobacteria bacterium]HXK46941.1 tartrate dehydrogenase [Deltaproteobacteria bacterium]